MGISTMSTLWSAGGFRNDTRIVRAEIVGGVDRDASPRHCRLEARLLRRQVRKRVRPELEGGILEHRLSELISVQWEGAAQAFPTEVDRTGLRFAIEDDAGGLAFGAAQGGDFEARDLPRGFAGGDRQIQDPQIGRAHV